MTLWEYRCLDCDTLVCRDDGIHEWLWCDSCCDLSDEQPILEI